MKLIAVFLLFFVAFASAQSDYVFTGYLADGTSTPLGLYGNQSVNSFVYTESSNQIVTVTISADSTTAFSVCLSEYALSNSGCPAEGSIVPPSDDDDVEVDFYGQEGGAKRNLLLRSLMEDGSNDFSFSANLTGLRYNTEYFVSAVLSDPSANETVTVTISWTPCPAKSKGVGPNCAVTAYTIPSTGSISGVTIDSNGALFSYDVVNTTTTYLELSFSAAENTAAFLFEDSNNSSLLTAYVRRGAFPVMQVNNTWVSVDANDSFTIRQVNSTYTVTINAPEQGLWYIFLVPTTNNSVTVNASATAFTQCEAGTFPWIGDSTSNMTNTCISPVTIGGTELPANGTTFTQSFVNGSTVAYFVWNTANLLVGVANTGSGDAPYLYASFSGLPLGPNAAFISANDAESNFLYVVSDEPANWVIAVQYPSGSDETEFLIWAGEACPNNCSAHGSFDEDYESICNPNTGVCNCANGYTGFDCSSTKLKTVYIVLIAIGGAIVLAIAIGVPIGCYIKNRKRARYERV